MLKSIVIPLLLVSLVIGVLIISCDSDDGSDLWWEVDLYGDFNTYDMERAQEQIPFKIVLPNHLPSNLSDIPWIKGPMKGECPEEDVTVLIHYNVRAEGDVGLVRIIEEGGNIQIYPASYPDAEIKKIEGIDVIQIEANLPQKPEDREMWRGYKFVWKQSVLFIEVGVYGYSQEESVNVIRSMIGQKGTVANLSLVYTA